MKADIHTIQAGVEELTIVLARMEGRFTAIEARFAEAEDRLAQMPTITQAIAPNVTTIFAVMGMAIAPLRLTGTAP